MECNSRIVHLRSHLQSFNLILIFGGWGWEVVAALNQGKSHDGVGGYGNLSDLFFQGS